jgi:hypothetical protein
LQAARTAVDRVLSGHEPYRAFAVDRHWTLVAANNALNRLLAGAAGEFLQPPVNVLRLSLHPDGLALRIANLAEWRAHLLARLRHQIDVTADSVLIALMQEVSGYPSRQGPRSPRATADHDDSVVVPLQLATAAGTLAFFSTTTTVFGSRRDIWRNWPLSRCSRPIERRPKLCVAWPTMPMANRRLAHAGRMRETTANLPSPRGRTTMSYDLDKFVSDCRSLLTGDPGPDGREQVRVRLEHLLANPEFVRTYCGDDVPRGLKVLYEDQDLGFQILAHINDKSRVSPPHDHGDSWAIYGQATHYTDMIEWERVDDGSDPSHATLQPTKKYRLMPGHAGIYQDGKIHSIDYPDHARFVRVTGSNLDTIKRIRFDLETGKVHQMTPQQAT